MTASRGWTLALAGASALSLILLYLTRGIEPRSAIGAAIIVAYLVYWLVTPFPLDASAPRQLATGIVTAVVTVALTTVESSLAVFQAFAIPLLWCVIEGTLRSILATAALSAAVGAGFALGSGAPVVAIIIQSVVLAFSIAMGLWIRQISALSEERGVLLERLTTAKDELAAMHRDAGAILERERLARELHDTIAQSLAGLVMLGQRARRELAGGAPNDATLALIETGARDALTETRSLVAETARVELPSGGLASALTTLGDRVERESGIRIKVTSRIQTVVDRDAEVVLLRCVQEGLANVRKHARASSARVELIAEVGAATVRVVDDGRGYDPERVTESGFGLAGLRERLQLVGGELTLDGTPGATSLLARMPLVGAGS